MSEDQLCQNELQRLWSDFLRIKFPETAVNKEIQGHCLVSIDLLSSQTVKNILNTNEQITEEQKKQLNSFNQTINTFFNELDENEKNYFEKLKNILTYILNIKNA